MIEKKKKSQTRMTKRSASSTSLSSKDDSSKAKKPYVSLTSLFDGSGYWYGDLIRFY